jgi:hypothetical protein
MILNAFGYAGRALYLTKRFFVNRPVEKLIGPDVTSDQMNDAASGTALDLIFAYGVTELFFQVASKILREQGIETRFAHLDSTTFTLHGEYNSESEDIVMDRSVLFREKYRRVSRFEMGHAGSRDVERSEGGIFFNRSEYDLGAQLNSPLFAHINSLPLKTRFSDKEINRTDK